MTVDEAWESRRRQRVLPCSVEVELGFRAGYAAGVEAAAPEWRPMIEAPRDGRTIVGRREVGILFFLRWDADLGEWLDEDSEVETLCVEFARLPR